MKKIMILGAGVLQLPAIICAREMGLTVIAVDMDPAAVGFRYADICLPISTIDIPKAVEAAEKYRIDAVITLASDMPMRTVAAVAEKLGLPGIDTETAIKATDKIEMRRCLKAHNVPVPDFYEADSYESFEHAIRNFSSEFIVKPADNSGSKGVYLVKDRFDKAEADNAYYFSKKYSRSGKIIVEEYMKGFEVSVEAFSIGKKVNILQITDKLTTGAPHFVEMGHSQPTQLPYNRVAQIKKITEDAVTAIGIKDCPSHTEIMITDEGPKIVELGARLGGDCITTHLVPLSTGIDMVKGLIKTALGETPDILPRFSKGSAIRYLHSKRGILRRVDGTEAAMSSKGIKEVQIVKNEGAQIEDISASGDRIGFVISQDNDAAAAVKDCEEAMKKITVVID